MIQCQKCDQAATIHITRLLEPRSRIAEFHLCEQHAREFLVDRESEKSAEWEAGNRAQEVDGAIKFDIDTIIINDLGVQQVVYLREVGGERRFPIVIGLFEATSLGWNLKGIRSPRPLTYDAWVSTIPSLGGEIEDVFIRELQQHTYFASIRIRQADRRVEIDVRPSDAFNVALICDVPIYVDESLADEICS